MADNNIKGAEPVKDEVEVEFLCCGCCCEIAKPKPITEITASSDDIKVDDSDKQDLDVFISSLAQPPTGSKIIADHGLISVIVGKFRQAQHVQGGGVQNYYQQKLEADMAEMERARGAAFGKLRAKAKKLDANAVLNIKVDLETAGKASIVYASGNAVQLDNRGQKGGGAMTWAGHDVPPYFPWSAAADDAVVVQPVEPLEMSRECKN